MNENVTKIYNLQNDIWGKPQQYNGLLLYPIKLSDIEYQELLLKIFCVPKNYINEKIVMKMSYLKFIFYLYYNINKGILEDVAKFMTHICQKECEILWKQHEEDVTFKINIEDKIIWEDDFENIREIILQQNGYSIEYVEGYNPELETILISQNKETSNIKLEDQVFIFCSLLHKTIFEIEDYTIYQFKKHFERLLMLKDFDLYKPLEVGGQIKLKEGNEIKHFLSPVSDKGRYGSILVNKDSFIRNNKDMFS